MRHYNRPNPKLLTFLRWVVHDGDVSAALADNIASPQIVLLVLPNSKH